LVTDARTAPTRPAGWLTNRDPARALFRDHLRGLGRHGGTLWSLLVLACWAKRYLGPGAGARGEGAGPAGAVRASPGGAGQGTASDLNLPLVVDSAGSCPAPQPVTGGVPCPKGMLGDPDALELADGEGP